LAAKVGSTPVAPTSEIWKNLAVGLREGHDVVVVGAGSAGAVIAARLSEDPDRRVLLVEAGPDHNSVDTPPSLVGRNCTAAAAEPGRLWPALVAIHATGQAPAPYPRGRGAGGSSAVNAQMGIRGLPEDYDAWGLDGWGWVDVEQVFVAMEDDLDFGDQPGHGRGGPIPLGRPPMEEWGALGRAFWEAALSAGYAVDLDYHRAGAEGLSPAALTRRADRRVSTNDAYLEPARARQNLQIRGDSLVDCVAMEGGRAVGVVLAGGEFLAAGEVVVCAGAIHSPAILLRSGISRPGVGAQLAEHAAAGINVVLCEGARSRPNDHTVCCGLRYTSGVAGTGRADMQVLCLEMLGREPPLLGVARLMVAVMQPFSRGRVRLSSLDPEADPVIEFNMLSDERDAVRLAAGMRRLLSLCRHSAISRASAGIVLDETGTTPDRLADQPTLVDWLRANVTNYVHATGTCSMGRADDPDAVVDPEGRVIGVEGVRVADASIIPVIPRANKHLTTVMVAERIAALMRTGAASHSPQCGGS
jgi:choline dehydrogenase-like flavoprotein